MDNSNTTTTTAFSLLWVHHCILPIPIRETKCNWWYSRFLSWIQVRSIWRETSLLRWERVCPPFWRGQSQKSAHKHVSINLMTAQFSVFIATSSANNFLAISPPSPAWPWLGYCHPAIHSWQPDPWGHGKGQRSGTQVFSCCPEAHLWTKPLLVIYSIPSHTFLLERCTANWPHALEHTLIFSLQLNFPT